MVKVERKSHLLGSEGILIANISEPGAVAETLSNIQPAAGLVEGDLSFVDAVDPAYPLVFGVVRKRDKLSPAIMGAQKDIEPLFPLYRLAALLKFPSNLDYENGVIRGTFMNAENTYELDAVNLTYTVNGERAALSPEDVLFISSTKSFGPVSGDQKELQDEIYVSEAVLNKLWGLKAEFDWARLQMDIKTPRKLPYEKERERALRYEYFEGGDGFITPDVYHVHNGYQALGPQSFVLSTSLNWEGEKRALRNSTNITGRGDLLGTSANYTLGLNSDEFDRFDVRQARATFTRRDNGSGEYLPLGLSQLEFGDIRAPTSPLIGAISGGRGLYIASDNQDRRRAFDRVSIDGTSVPGWDVELYRGPELLDFGVVGEDGRYEFEDIALNYGNNKFRVVLYGPQGQVEEREEEYRITGRRQPVGTVAYEAALIDSGRELINVSGFDRQKKDPTKYARIDVGLASWASGFATLTEAPFRSGTERYYSFGASFDALGGAGQVEVIKQAEKGQAVDVRFGRKFFDFNTNFQTTFYNNFESTRAGFGSANRDFEGDLRVNRSFKLPFAGLNLAFNVGHDRYADGTKETRLGTTQGLTFKKFSIGNTISTLGRTDNDRNAQGNINFNARLTDQLTARAGLGYDIQPSGGFDAASLSLGYREDKFRSDFRVQRGLQAENTSVRAQASYDFGSFLGGATAQWDNERGFDFALRASTTFGPDGVGGAYITTTEYQGMGTALKLRLYEDTNFDGVFDENDIPVPGVRVLVDGRATEVSDENGIIEQLGIGPERLVYLTVDERSFRSSLLRPIKEGYSVVLRNGTKPFINFPLYETGVIDGSVKFPSGRGVGGMRVHLLNNEGELVEEATTLYDGFYLFEFVRPGNYIVRLDPSYRINVPPQTITVSSEKGLFAYGVDFLLEQASEDAAADIEKDVREGGRVAQKTSAPVAVGTLLPAPTLSDRPSYTAIRAVRIGEHPYKVRFVLDLSAPSVYRLSTESDGAVINVDLKDTVWDVPEGWSIGEHPIFKSVKAYAMPSDTEEGTRVRLEAHEGARIFYNAQIPAENGLPDRIYLDLIRKK